MSEFQKDELVHFLIPCHTVYIVSQIDELVSKLVDLLLVPCIHVTALDSKTPKAEDIEEEDDDVPGRTSNKTSDATVTCFVPVFPAFFVK